MNLHLHISLTLPNKLITIYPCFFHQPASVSGGLSMCLEVPLSFYVGIISWIVTDISL